MSAHTPGPWVVSERLYVMSGDAMPGSDNVIAHCDCAGIPESQEFANARLIAASPRLYEYVNRKAVEGDSDAAEIIASIG